MEQTLVDFISHITFEQVLIFVGIVFGAYIALRLACGLFVLTIAVLAAYIQSKR